MDVLLILAAPIVGAILICLALLALLLLAAVALMAFGVGRLLLEWLFAQPPIAAVGHALVRWAFGG